MQCRLPFLTYRIFVENLNIIVHYDLSQNSLPLVVHVLTFVAACGVLNLHLCPVYHFALSLLSKYPQAKQEQEYAGTCRAAK